MSLSEGSGKGDDEKSFLSGNTTMSLSEGSGKGDDEKSFLSGETTRVSARTVKKRRR